jgi:hypothetical protein
MDAPPIPQTRPGQPALPAFQALEAYLAERHAAAREASARRVQEAEAEATRIRREGEERLARLVMDAEGQALREAEDRARDRVSAVRKAIEHWVDGTEAGAGALVEEALRLLAEA